MVVQVVRKCNWALKQVSTALLNLNKPGLLNSGVFTISFECINITAILDFLKYFPLFPTQNQA
jgi:hypothetical protein